MRTMKMLTIKKLMTICLLSSCCHQVFAESIDMSLTPATKHVFGRGFQVLSLEKEPYRFSCTLMLEEMPPPGMIFIDITLCTFDQVRHCPFAYSEGYPYSKQPVIHFKFTPQTEYIGKNTYFSVIVDYVPNDRDQPGAVAKYHLSCEYS